MIVNKDKHPMLARIGKPAMYEQLAEEASELAHACMKMARILRNENPTPVSEVDAYRHVIEEYTDVYQCGEELNIRFSPKQIREKQNRFLQRWEESGKDILFNSDGKD